VEIQLSRYDLSSWDTVNQMWRVEKGRVEIFVGRSSRDIVLEGSINVVATTGSEIGGLA
jgi:beta-glucosidase